MNQRTVVLLAGLAASASLAWAGDEPEKYEIAWKEKWKVGQVVTVVEHEDEESTTTVDGKAVRSEKTALDATYVVRCDEIDDKGACTRRTLFMKSWKRTANNKADESISGLIVTVTGKTWKLPEGKVAGKQAKAWLDHAFAKDDDSPFSKLTPPARMAVGESWKPSLKEAEAALPVSKDAPPFDLAAVELELKLASVEGVPPDATGRFEFRMHLPVKGVPPGLPEGSVMLPGSGAEGVGDRTGPLTTSTMFGTEHMVITMKCDLEIPKEEGKLLVTSVTKGNNDKKTVAGGEIPAVPAADAKEPPAGK